MSLTVVKGLQSEIFVPITPPSVWTPVTKELKDMSIALATAAGVHKKDQERFNLAGDFTWRKIENTTPSSELMVSHGDMITVMLIKTSTVCSRLIEFMNLQQKDLLGLVLLYMQDSWAAAETRRSSKVRLDRRSHRCLKKRM